MTAVNHTVMGSVVVAAVGNPIVGLPLALISHFVLDSLPHFGVHTVADPKSREFRAVLVTDMLLTAVFLLIVAFASYRVGLPVWLLVVGGFLGWLPDVMWYKHYQNDLRGEKKQWGPIRKFHKSIQRYERSWGWAVELLVFFVLVLVLNRIIFA